MSDNSYAKFFLGSILPTGVLRAPEMEEKFDQTIAKIRAAGFIWTYYGYCHGEMGDAISIEETTVAEVEDPVEILALGHYPDRVRDLKEFLLKEFGIQDAKVGWYLAAVYN